METIVQKMGVDAPSNNIQKRRFIDGLCDPELQKLVSLTRPIDLATTKQEALNWEEVKINEMHRHQCRQGAKGELNFSRSCTRDYLNVDAKQAEEESKGNEVMKAQVCALREQLEQECILYNQSIKDLLEKMSYIEIEL